MSALNLLLDNLDPLAELLLQALLRTLWQGMLIAGLVWLLLRIFKQASATTRHAVWLASLMIISALPFIAIATSKNVTPTVLQQAQSQRPLADLTPTAIPPVTYPQNSVGQIGEQPLPGLAKQQPPARVFADLDQIVLLKEARKTVTLSESASANHLASLQPTVIKQAPAVKQIPKQSFWQRTSNWFFDSRMPLALMILWLLISGMMLGRLAYSYHGLLDMRRSMQPADEARQQRVEQLTAQYGIGRFVLLFTSAKVKVPMTVGALKPVIVLPPHLAGELSDSEFDSVAAHELAHIRRWDYSTNLLQRFAQAFLFFHPAVWFIGDQLMIERELACDDWAVKMCEPRRYASCLTRLVEMLGDSRPLAAAAGILFGKHVISRRVEMILNRERNATTAVSKPALAYAIGMAALLVVACSLMSPVIAVPLGQQKAKQQKKETKATSPATAQTVPLPPAVPEALPPDFADFPEIAAEAPLPPPPPDIADAELAALDEAALTALLQDPPRPAQTPQPAPPAVGVAGGISGGIPGGVIGGVATTAPVAVGGTIWAQSPVAATIVGGWDQDGKKKDPTIPEAEMLNLLVDIVKKDTDANVRQEALQGIYRMRSEAASNALVSLYDSISDPKSKGEIIAYLLRREGDNSKAIAKLTQIAKTETNEELRNRAIRYLGNVKGDEGATNLIQIYDTVQDAKTKQYLIRSLAYNKSPKAVEKLKQIAKNDTDPQIRSAAIRSLYSIDGRLYMETLGPGQRIGMLDFDREFIAPRAFEFDGKMFEFDAKRWEEMSREWQEKWKLNQDKYKELFEKMQIDGLDKLKLEMPKLELKLKELEDRIKIEKDVNLISPVENQLRSQISQLSAQVATVNRNNAGSSAQPALQETISLLNSLNRQLGRTRPIRVATPRPAVTVTPDVQIAPTPRPARPVRSTGEGPTASSGAAR
ncbi:MAG: HEAT repeat domain-containing protein [Acidobacteria bacterium]|nr:HEAT repeat domain-containing protein [Acidobacteriota bacterium]